MPPAVIVPLPPSWPPDPPLLRNPGRQNAPTTSSTTIIRHRNRSRPDFSPPDFTGRDVAGIPLFAGRTGLVLPVF